MTTTAKAPRKATAKNKSFLPRRGDSSLDSVTTVATRSLPPIEGLTLGGEPRIHLLPPQVLVDRKSRIVRRRLGIGVIGVLVLVAIGFGAASLSLVNSQANLLTAQNATNSILQQQAKYGDVLKVKADASSIQSSQKQATADEILWQPFVSSFEATIPAGGSITNVSLSLDNPFGLTNGAPGQSAGPLIGTHIATINSSVTLPQGEIAGWLNSLPKLKGFVDVTPTSVASVSGGKYIVTITMHLDKDVLANRFATTTGDGN